jgi:hypothetical protein
MKRLVGGSGPCGPTDAWRAGVVTAVATGADGMRDGRRNRDAAAQPRQGIEAETASRRGFVTRMAFGPGA